MRTSLVSIVLPTYNGEKFIRDTICSVIQQTFQNWELLIVNDASIDNTRIVVEKFIQQDVRIKYLEHSTNKNLPAALNTGFSNAKGEFLTWISDDNLFFPQSLEVMVNHLLLNPEIGLVYSDYNLIDENNYLLGNVILPYPPALHLGNSIGPCFLYRRAVFEKIGNYREEYFLVEDYDYWIRVASYFSIGKVSQTLYAYRKHRNSLSSTKITQIKEKFIQVLIENKNYLAKLTRVERSLAYRKIVKRYRRIGKIPLARKYLVKAFFLSPSTVLKDNNKEAIKVLLGDRVTNIIGFLLSKIRNSNYKNYFFSE